MRKGSTLKLFRWNEAGGDWTSEPNVIRFLANMMNIQQLRNSGKYYGGTQKQLNCSTGIRPNRFVILVFYIWEHKHIHHSLNLPVMEKHQGRRIIAFCHCIDIHSWTRKRVLLSMTSHSFCFRRCFHLCWIINHTHAFDVHERRNSPNESTWVCL